MSLFRVHHSTAWLFLALAFLSPAAPGQSGEVQTQTLPNGLQVSPGMLATRKPTQLTSKPTYLINPPAVIPVSGSRQLFVDDFLIERTTLKRVFHRPKPDPLNPILKTSGSDRLFAIPFSDGVWYDPADHRYKMFYFGGNNNAVALATSIDGKTWIRPSIPDAENPGSNAVISLSGRDSSTVWMDLTSSAKKFRAFVYTGGNRLSSFHSPDGIHWTRDVFQIPSVSDRTTMFWNPWRQRWVESTRSSVSLPASDTRQARDSRVRYYSESQDLVTWTPEQDTMFWSGPDEDDPPYPGYSGHFPELYNLDAVAYESVLVGLFSWFYDAPGPNLVEVGIGFSRDGIQWDRPVRGGGPANAFLPASNVDGSWNGFNTQSVGGGFLVVGDELRFYYSGRNARHGVVPTETGTGLATLRRDGFASMDAGAEEGTLTTRVLSFDRGELFVNLNCRAGTLRAEILDESGSPVEPFTRANSIPVSIDSTLQRMRWTNEAELSALAGQKVRIRFYLTNGSLYSFWVSKSGNGESDGYVAAGGPGFESAADSKTYPSAENDVAPAIRTAITGAEQPAIELETNEPATCYFSESAGTRLNNMRQLASTGSLRHAEVVPAPVNQTATYYVRCRDRAGNENTDDLLVSIPPQDSESGTHIAWIHVSDITASAARIRWATDRKVDGSNARIIGGTIAEREPIIARSDSAGQIHEVRLTGLTPGTRYRYVVSSPAGSLLQQRIGHFTTTETRLIISECRVISIKRDSAVVFWKTNRNASGQVQFGTATGFERAVAGSDVGSTENQILLTGLQPESAYRVRVTASDPDGEVAASNELNFTTMPGRLSFSEVETKTEVSSATISWQTNLPSKALVSFGTTQSYRGGAIASEQVSTAHSVVLRDLFPDTQYYARIQSTSGDYTSTYEPVAFRTARPQLTVSEFSVYAVGPSSAFVSWRSSRPTAAIVDYGVTREYGKRVEVTGERVSNYTQLTGLTPATRYFVRVTVRDGADEAEHLGEFTTSTSTAVDRGR